MSQDTEISSNTELDTEQQIPTKKRRWLRRLIWFIIILTILAYLISGIGIRKTGEYFINKSLEEQGMTGSLELLGSIDSGFQLKNLNYTGEKGIQLLEVDEMALDYKLSELQDFKIDLLKVKGLKAVIDIDKFPPSPEKTKSSTDWKETLSFLKPILTNPEIDISDLDVSILQSAEKMVHFQLGSIQHSAKSNEINLNDWKVTDANGLSTPTQSSKLIWNDKSMSFDSLELIPNLALGDINFNWKDELKGNTSISYHDAKIHLDVNQDESKSIDINLSQGALKASDVFDTLNSFGIATDGYEREVSISKLSINMPLSDELMAGDFNVDWKNELTANVGITYHKAIVDIGLNHDDTNSLSLNLAQGELKTENIFNTLNGLGIETQEYDTEAVIDQIVVNLPLSNLELTPPHWKIKSTLGIKSARYENYTTKGTTIHLDQDALKYQVSINGQAQGAPLNLDIKGTWTSPEKETFWKDTDVQLDLNTEFNDSIVDLIAKHAEIPNDIKINRSKISLSAKSNIASLIPNATTADLDLSGISISNNPLPTLGIKANLDKNIFNLNLRTKQQSALIVDASADLFKFTYNASFITKTSTQESPWINALASIYKLPVRIADELDITWNGSGNISANTHNGKFTSKNLIINQIQKNGDLSDPITVNLIGDYKWPENINLEKIDIKQQELFASSSFSWDGETIKINPSQVQRFDETIANISGYIPFNLDIDNANKFFNQTSNWNLTIDTEELRLKRISELIPLPNDPEVTGTLQTSLKIKGSPKNPTLDGNLNIHKLNDVFELGLGEITFDSKFNTSQQSLIMTGNILEAGSELADLKVTTPFKPQEWLNDDNLIITLLEDSEILGTASIKQFPLNRLDNFVPELKKIEGLFDVDANFKGTVSNPKYKINFSADLPIVSLKDVGLDKITEIQLTGSIDESLVLKSQLDAKINGGKFNITADVDLNEPTDPNFNVNLVTNHALVYRNEAVAMRSNVNLNLTGNLAEATLSGEIGILESLFYQDIDLIPIGVPSTTVKTVSLPSLNTTSTSTIPIPAPFDKWKLNVTLKTIDPILIRGNIGNGQVEGSVKVNGSLSKPNLDGTFLTKDVSAKLPFSTLKINTGKIIFKPNNGFIPKIQVLGKSQIGEYNVTINAYGSADNPQLTLSSLPALPETEIITLLATGATNTGLTNSDVATFKTLQLLLLELKQRSERPGGNRLFGKLVDRIDQLNLKVGEVNQLTGEKFASATFKLHRRWFLSAQIDDNQPPQTRGLLIFALRFN